MREKAQLLKNERFPSLHELRVNGIFGLKIAMNYSPKLLNGLLLTFFLLTSAKRSFAQNSVSNGTFNGAGTSWTFFAPGTTTESYNPETSYGGTLGTNIVAEIDNEANLRQTAIPVTAGIEHAISFRHTRRTGNGAAPNPSVFIVRVYDGTNVYVNQTITNTNATWNWQCKLFTFTPQTNTVSIDLENVTATTLGSIVDDITIAPVQQNINMVGLSCQGGSIELQAPNYPGDPNSNYTGHNWTGPGGFTATGASVTINNLQQVHNGIYSCAMLLNQCFEVVANIQLTVSPNEFERNISICEGTTYDFYGRILSQAGLYDTLIEGGGTQCDSLIRLDLTILPKPEAKILPEPAVDICADDEALLRLTEESPGATYQWYRNNTAINNATASNYHATTSGTYYVVVSLNGCENTSNSTMVTVHPTPQAKIAYNDELLCTMDTMLFSVALPDADHTYSWEPKTAFNKTGGPEGTVVNAILEYPENKIVLTIYDSNGCRGKDSVFIKTVSCCEMMMPNAFTPNADGKNDYFKPHLDVGQRVMTFEIFDRYGSVVYGNYVGGATKGWDGHYRDGKPATLGVYMYYLRYLCSDGKIYSRKGEVTLYR